MSKRTITTYAGRNRRGRPMTIKVRYYSDTEEWVCEVTIDGCRREQADYFTNDRGDALATARYMAGYAPAPEGCMP